MKLLKKLTALMLAVVLVMTLSITVFAADDDTGSVTPTPVTTVNITIDGAAAGATYKAYRLLNTTVSLKKSGCHDDEKDHTSACYNIGYGKNEPYWEIVTELTRKSTEHDVYTYIQGLTSADAIYGFAESVYAKVKDKTADATVTEVADETADGKVQLTNVTGGYWLIVEIPADGYQGVYSLLLMDTVGKRNLTIHTKRDTLTLEKKVQDNGASYGQFADHQIGESARFWILSDVPDHIEAYNGTDDAGKPYYKYIIHDKMETGLTFEPESVEIRLNAQDGTLLYSSKNDDVQGTAEDYFTLITTETETGDGCAFHIEVNMKGAIAAGKLKASDRLYIYYNAKLNSSASVIVDGKDVHNANGNTAWLQYSNNPNNKTTTTTTAESTAYVWTFRFNLVKVDHDDVGLDGAKFVLSLDPNLPATAMTVETLTQYTNDLIPLKKQVKTGEEEHEHYHISDSRKDADYVITAGEAAIGGFDDQTEYYLYEITPPAGYNKLNEPTLIKFTASYDGANANQHFATGYPKIIVGNNAESSVLEARVVNQTGTELPSTGGIGTTIFYVLGGIMVVGAAVLLITKKRMGAEV